MESTSSIPLLWQMIISFGSGVFGVTVAGFLNHFLMIRQEHKLKIFNARMEAFFAFSSNTEMYTKKNEDKNGRNFFLSEKNRGIIRRIILVGSKDITSKCASALIAFLTKEEIAFGKPLEEANKFFDLFLNCMKYDLGHTKINLNQKPRGKDARSLEKLVNEMEEKLSNREKN